MLLVCDIGNSRIKTGIFSKDELIEFSSFANTESFSSIFINHSINQIAISSVVPKLTDKILKLFTNYSDSKAFVIDRNVNFSLEIDYDSIDTLGVDRICSAEGALYLYKNSNNYKNYDSNTFIISIDFGTATTINIILYPGVFIGGTISPGIKTMFDSLNTKTAQLPSVSEADYKKIIGRNTFSSIASGVINSNIGLIDRTINYLKSEMKASDFKIFVTGGNAEKLIPHFNFDFTFVKELVLIGIKTVYDKNIT